MGIAGIGQVVVKRRNLIIQRKAHFEGFDRLIKIAFLGIGSPEVTPYFRVILSFSKVRFFEIADDFVILLSKNKRSYIFEKYFVT